MPASDQNERLRRKLELRIKLDLAQALHAEPLSDKQRRDAWLSLTKPEVLQRLIADMTVEELGPFAATPLASVLDMAAPQRRPTNLH